MRILNLVAFLSGMVGSVFGADMAPAVFPTDPGQELERTCFQTDRPWRETSNLRSDVAIVYGIDPKLPERIQTWREHGYRIHVMTGVSWGQYQDYLYGRFDGVNHEDDAQTLRDGSKRSHGGDVYYMCPSANYGKFLCVGVQRALDAGAEAIHLEEPEFWVNTGYSEGFKREWQSYYGEPWQAPHTSVNAQWRTSKLKYFLYRRALQQVFDYVQEFNQRAGKRVRCYVPTHSLLNYASWEIVSPESSLAQLKGCDGYIAQVWTGTARTPNKYGGKVRERTFETAFLEYGAMQNLVHATGRTVWYLNDPIEDNPNHDWADYQQNWESTLTASLLQPEVWQFEVAPWPERIFNGRYPKSAAPENRQAIPPSYAAELQIVMNALNEMKQDQVHWDCGTTGIGQVISDSLMFQRGEPQASDRHLSQIYGTALPLLKRGIPVAPVQLENVTVPHYLDGFKVLVLTYHGMKPLTSAVHTNLAAWVRSGGALICCDDDSDPYRKVSDWWNSNGLNYETPRQHLFEQLGISSPGNQQTEWAVGAGKVLWLRENPARLAETSSGAEEVVATLKLAALATKLNWRETNYLLLERGPFVIAAGLDESISNNPKTVRGRFVNLFDSSLRVQNDVSVEPGRRYFLRNLDYPSRTGPALLASACKALETARETNSLSLVVEGIARTPAVLLLNSQEKPAAIELAGEPLTDFEYSPTNKLLWIRFKNEAFPRNLTVRF